jgi:cardiolipin synthase A/B
MIRPSTAVSILFAPLALIGAQHLLRRPPVRRIRASGGIVPVPVSDPGFRSLLEMHVRSPVHSGNRVEVLRNGDETFPRLLKDLRHARRSIEFQVYYAAAGTLADRVGEILRGRARAGVRVHFLYDAFGGLSLPESYLQDLRDAGVEVRASRSLHVSRLCEVPHRSHVRCVVIDGRIGYTGGFGLADKWLGSGEREGEWRETNARLEGPAARQFAAAFAFGWADAAHELLLDEPLPFETSAEGHATAGLLHLSPELGSTPAERFLALSVAAARERLWIASAYFVPDAFLSQLLCDAASRGVDVRVLTASRTKSDAPLAYWAGRERYEALLRGGVRLWEYEPAMMHAKTFVVDGRWCTIGAINFDNRSQTLMDETTLMVLDEEVGAAMERFYIDDLDRSAEVRLDAFQQRPLFQRATEKGASTLSRVL